MANSVLKDIQGPDWPLGVIVVPSPGTPVSIMSLIDAANLNAPETATVAYGLNQAPTQLEYTVLAQSIQFQAFKSNTHGLQTNTGNIYITRRGVQGNGNRDDYGAIVAVLSPGQTTFIPSGARTWESFNPYRYYVDADVANDSVLVTLWIQ